MLARSLTTGAHGGLLVAHLYSTQSTHSAARLPTATHVPMCYQNDLRENRTWQCRSYSERYSPCKLTALLSYRNLQLLFWYLIGRSLTNVVHGGLLSHSYTHQNQHTHCTPSDYHVPKCYESDSRDYRTWQWRACGERCSTCKQTAVLSYRNLQ